MIKTMLTVGMAAATAASAQTGDAAAGQKVFARCAICHAVGPDAKSKLGPNLNGIVGRKSATVPGFAYSPAMTNAKLVWKASTIEAYITAPQKMLPGNKMAFVGLPQAKDRADVIAYLAQFGPDGAKK